MAHVLGAALMLCGAIAATCGIAFFEYLERYYLLALGVGGMLWGFLLWIIGDCRERLISIEKHLEIKGLSKD